MRKNELLVPASSLEVLKIAVIYGADAVYIGGEAFGLRAKAKNFTMEEMAEGIAFPVITKPGRKSFLFMRTRTASAMTGMFTLWWTATTPDLQIYFLPRHGGSMHWPRRKSLLSVTA